MLRAARGVMVQINTMNPDEIIDYQFEVLPLDEGLKQVFQSFELPVLGGSSGDYGWSSIRTFQECAYLFKRTYVDPKAPAPTNPWNPAPTVGYRSFALDVGSAFHAFCAVKYAHWIAWLASPEQGTAYPLTPEILKERLFELNCDAEVIAEAWRLFASYEAKYDEEEIFEPLAVEHHVVLPGSRFSARYDLIARVPYENEQCVPGTYIVQHKTASRFDDATLTGWANDGGVLQELLVWKRAGLDEQFGPLRGEIVNIVGKQKVPQFYRYVIVPDDVRLAEHERDLRVWSARRQLALAEGSFPRSRASCIGKYGKCFEFEHCSGLGSVAVMGGEDGEG